MNYQPEVNALLGALRAAQAKATEIWERDGREDRGTCGGACLELNRNSRLFKAAQASRVVGLSDGFVHIPLPEGICTQNADVYQGQMGAFRESLVTAGYGAAIKRFWTYID